jgi:hypothetical protein
LSPWKIMEEIQKDFRFLEWCCWRFICLGFDAELLGEYFDVLRIGNCSHPRRLDSLMSKCNITQFCILNAFTSCHFGHPVCHTYKTTCWDANVTYFSPHIISFHCHMQNVTIPCHSQVLLPFLSVIYFFLPLFSTNYSSILHHFILSFEKFITV